MTEVAKRVAIAAVVTFVACGTAYGLAVAFLIDENWLGSLIAALAVCFLWGMALRLTDHARGCRKGQMTDLANHRRELILASAADQALDFLVHDRKEDEELPRGEIESAIDTGHVTVDEIANTFRAALVEALGERT